MRHEPLHQKRIPRTEGVHGISEKGQKGQQPFEPGSLDTPLERVTQVANLLRAQLEGDNILAEQIEAIQARPVNFRLSVEALISGQLQVDWELRSIKVAGEEFRF